MPEETNADSVTPEEGAVETLTVLQLQQALADEQRTTQTLMDRLEALERRTSSVENDEPRPQVITPPTVRDGYKRYRSRWIEGTYVKDGAFTTIVEGRPVRTRAKTADFTGGVYETDDPEMQEFMDNHPENGTTFWEDPSAIRNHSTVQVVDGMRSSEQSVRSPLEVPVP